MFLLDFQIDYSSVEVLFFSPIIMKINKKCTKEFQLYDDCLQKNPSTVQRCSAELELFSLCAEAVAELEVDSSDKT